MQWECKNALLGFTKVNNTHNGKRLGGALFQVLDHVGIAHKVCHLLILGHLFRSNNVM
jgi:hypothetical protein